MHYSIFIDHLLFLSLLLFVSAIHLSIIIAHFICFMYFYYTKSIFILHYNLHLSLPLIYLRFSHVFSCHYYYSVNYILIYIYIYIYNIHVYIYNIYNIYIYIYLISFLPKNFLIASSNISELSVEGGFGLLIFYF